MNRILSLFIPLFIVLNSACSKDDASSDNSKPAFSSVPGARLGDDITLDGKNFEMGKLQVFFDDEESSVYYVTDKKIRVSVPRSITRFNPTLRIVDLNTNENILEETFLLNKPVITGFNSTEISFQESLYIKGVNFDIDRKYVKVSVNGERANVIRASHDEIEVQLPTALSRSDLQVSVNAQLQEVVAEQSLKLSKPEINNTPDDFWVGQELVLEGSGFNPDGKFASLLVDGKETTISSGVTHTIRSRYPSGPYKDFFISEVIYKMADYEIVLKGNWEIKNNGIIVDYDPGYIASQPVVYNNKAYAYFWKKDGLYDSRVTLYEFSYDNQRWAEVPGSSFIGYIDNVIYNNNGFLYVYKNPDDSPRTLSRIDLNTLTEETVPLPFADNRQLTFMVHFQEKFYVLGGEAIDEDYNINDVADHWMLDETTDTWSELDSGPVFDHFSNRNNGFWSGFLHNGALYMYFDNTTHRLNPDMSLETLGGEIYMVYKNTLISPNNYRGGFRDYEADYLVPGVEHNLGFAYELRHFFVLGEEVYFKKDEATYKLKKEILNEIL